MKRLLMLSALIASSVGLANAADALHNTTWQTFEGDQPKAIVKITEKNGALTGKIVSTTRPEGQKFVGRTVISNLMVDGNGKYSDGNITDPENGKTYKLSGQLKGNTLKLTGHLGPFKRTQTWQRR